MTTLSVHVDVQKGVITGGRVFSDCLVPPLIDAFNDELSSAASEASAEGSLGSIAYDVAGVAELCARVRARLGDDEGTRVARDEYIPQLQEWLSAEI